MTVPLSSLTPEFGRRITEYTTTSDDQMAPEGSWEVNGISTTPSTAEKLLVHHKENHFTAGEVVRDVILGVSDGLTVPFALAAGLSGANAPSSLILTAGLAEVAAGAISMGLGGSVTPPSPSASKLSALHTLSLLRMCSSQTQTIAGWSRWGVSVMDRRGWVKSADGRLRAGTDGQSVLHVGRYLAAKSEADHYMRELKREQEEIVTVPDIGIVSTPPTPLHLVKLCRLIVFELGLEKPDPKRALQSALTIALSYVVGGLVPLLPYVFIPIAQKAMLTSIGVTLAALLFFGYVKGQFTGNHPLSSAVQTTFIGALASAAAYALAKLFTHHVKKWEDLMGSTHSKVENKVSLSGKGNHFKWKGVGKAVGLTSTQLRTRTPSFFIGFCHDDDVLWRCHHK
ncbi:hypothetical protein B296_00041128 [Ensete ventricosum]|uniref:DUF125-domain-containing protein n=1 Tax=Ensete ventricosum TaxID=4639 RepID=A0A426YTT4_ENSVE|nr:hypothetical protein B296_00041128 [Ensete ventricosum]